MISESNFLPIVFLILYDSSNMIWRVFLKIFTFYPFIDIFLFVILKWIHRGIINMEVNLEEIFRLRQWFTNYNQKFWNVSTLRKLHKISTRPEDLDFSVNFLCTVLLEFLFFKSVPSLNTILFFSKVLLSSLYCRTSPKDQLTAVETMYWCRKNVPSIFSN